MAARRFRALCLGLLGLGLGLSSVGCGVRGPPRPPGAASVTSNDTPSATVQDSNLDSDSDSTTDAEDCEACERQERRLSE
ncbi:MAG: hypothetical protein LBM75_06085 [Myxococcales bacterium]|nr:hypothetical protein [Myxococcales bacterium]